MGADLGAVGAVGVEHDTEGGRATAEGRGGLGLGVRLDRPGVKENPQDWMIFRDLRIGRIMKDYDGRLFCNISVPVW